MNKKFSIDKDKCIGCGLCIKDCSTIAIKMGEDNKPFMTEKGNINCMSCQHCLAICPTGAISILGKSSTNSTQPLPTSNEEILNVIKSRKSCRHYKEEDVPEDFPFKEDVEIIEEYYSKFLQLQKKINSF